MIRIPPKFGSKLESESEPESESDFNARLAKHYKQRGLDKALLLPRLENLFFLYYHSCDIFLPSGNKIGYKYVGQGYGHYYRDRNNDYDTVGKILAQM